MADTTIPTPRGTIEITVGPDRYAAASHGGRLLDAVKQEARDEAATQGKRIDVDRYGTRRTEDGGLVVSFGVL